TLQRFHLKSRIFRMSILANKGKRSECFLRILALLLIYMQVVNSQGLSEISDMFVELSYIDGQTNNLREKRDVNADVLQYIIIIEVNVSQAIFFNQIKSSLESFSSFQVDNTTEIDSLNITTACSLNGTEYQCSCEDQYFWPSEKCTLYGSCDNITNFSCDCINTFPNDGQFCQPFNELLNNSTCPSPPIPAEYLIEFEIGGIYAPYLNYVVNSLKTDISIFINITEVNVTTVCILNGAEYQCWCQDQYFWSCETCTLYVPCDDVANTSCGCINALPNDGHFCQPANELTYNSTCPPNPVP
ncbi:adhesion G protein-coupled receptor F5-like, partial [Clarias magur]